MNFSDYEVRQQKYEKNKKTEKFDDHVYQSFLHLDDAKNHLIWGFGLLENTDVPKELQEEFFQIVFKLGDLSEKLSEYRS